MSPASGKRIKVNLKDVFNGVRRKAAIFAKEDEIRTVGDLSRRIAELYGIDSKFSLTLDECHIHEHEIIDVLKEDDMVRVVLDPGEPGEEPPKRKKKIKKPSHQSEEDKYSTTHVQELIVAEIDDVQPVQPDLAAMEWDVVKDFPLPEKKPRKRKRNRKSKPCESVTSGTSEETLGMQLEPDTFKERKCKQKTSVLENIASDARKETQIIPIEEDISKNSKCMQEVMSSSYVTSEEHNGKVNMCADVDTPEGFCVPEKNAQVIPEESDVEDLPVKANNRENVSKDLDYGVLQANVYKYPIPNDPENNTKLFGKLFEMKISGSPQKFLRQTQTHCHDQLHAPVLHGFCGVYGEDASTNEKQNEAPRVTETFSHIPGNSVVVEDIDREVMHLPNNNKENDVMFVEEVRSPQIFTVTTPLSKECILREILKGKIPANVDTYEQCYTIPDVKSIIAFKLFENVGRQTRRFSNFKIGKLVAADIESGEVTLQLLGNIEGVNSASEPPPQKFRWGQLFNVRQLYP